MRNSRDAGILNFDWVSVLIYISLVLIGIISIYSATYTKQDTNILQTFYGKQSLWFAFSFVLILMVGLVNIKFIKNNASLFYLIGIFLLIAVLILGVNINGNRSWFRIGKFGLQPAEFAKLTSILGLSKLLTEPNFDLGKIKNIFQATLLILTPILFILMQPDLGSAIIFLSLFIVLYREGLHAYFYIFIFLTALLFILTIYFGQNKLLIAVGILFMLLNALGYLVFKTKVLLKTGLILFISVSSILATSIVFNKVLKPHQRNRIEIVLNKKHDDKGTGYNLKQALIAIGTGGLHGKGLLKGTQTQGDYIPEQHTDWILSVIGEQWGFMGTMTVVLLYTFLLLRLIFLAERQKQKFSRILGYGVVSILFFHYALNMLMVIGLFPTIGIPLAFLSYGGSSLWAFTLMLFIFLKFDAHRIEDW